MKEEFTRVAVRVGSNILTRQNGALDVTRMPAPTDQIAALHKAGMEITLISSGVVASGRSEMRTLRKFNSVDQRQLPSAVGQAKLISRYHELFRGHDVTVGQILITEENFGTRRHYLNQKNCITVMPENGVIPIVNENDTVPVTELMLTDNGELSGLIAPVMGAQTLIILSNTDGIYNGSPIDPTSSMIQEIGQGEDLISYVQTSKSSFGRGGILTKTNIAHKVADEGITVVIANGECDSILIGLTEHPEETIYACLIPTPQPMSSIKKWAAHNEGFAKGEVHVSEQASEVLNSDRAVSILPIGATRIEGEFEKDDITRITDNRGVPMGVGETNCDLT